MLAIFSSNLYGTGPGEQGDSSFWSTSKVIGLFFSQHSYSEYYKGGGINSVALGSNFNLSASLERDRISWDHTLKARYGIIKMANHPIQKNDDHFEYTSKYGYKISKHFQLSALIDFQTRFHDIYNIGKKGERGKRIGNFLAPAFINLGSGIDYKLNKKILCVFYSPINSKITVVKDETLIPQYLPDAKVGQKARYELGSLLRVELKKELMTNVHVHTTGTLFTNHLENFGKIDINFENKIKFTVNELFSVNLLTQVVYDEDILFDIPIDGMEGPASYKAPRTQFREVLNIGLTQKF